MAPEVPHWQQPSHPSIQEVAANELAFMSKSLAKVELPPFAVFARLEFPPCQVAKKPTYATVQMSKDQHLNLNSDLVYINHSCEPSLIFDMGNMNILVGPKGIKPGDELTFFYPSTEWQMAQPFDCLCGKLSCRGRISGAMGMTPQQLEGVWLNGHILALPDERKRDEAIKEGARRELSLAKPSQAPVRNKILDEGPVRAQAIQGAFGIDGQLDQTAEAMQSAIRQAEKVVEALHLALRLHLSGQAKSHRHVNGSKAVVSAGPDRRGPTSRELSGEVGGDTPTGSRGAMCMGRS